MRTNFINQISKNNNSLTNRIMNFFYAKYWKSNFKEMINKSKYLNSDESFLNYRLLNKHESIFYGTLGKYTGTEYNIELIEGAQPYHTKTFCISKVHKETF